MASIRAVYQDGKLQLLDPVNLSDGQEVRLQILSDTPDRVREALSDLVHSTPTDEVDTFDEVALQQLIDDAANGVTLSDLIKEERRTA